MFKKIKELFNKNKKTEEELYHEKVLKEGAFISQKILDEYNKSNVINVYNTQSGIPTIWIESTDEINKYIDSLTESLLMNIPSHELYIIYSNLCKISESSIKRNKMVVFGNYKENKKYITICNNLVIFKIQLPLIDKPDEFKPNRVRVYLNKEVYEIYEINEKENNEIKIFKDIISVNIHEVE